MQPARFASINLAGPGAPTPTVIARAAAIPQRIVIQNTLGFTVFVSDAAADLAPTLSSSAMPILGSSQVVLVIAEKQSLYGLGSVAGLSIGIAVSDAMPVAGG